MQQFFSSLLSQRVSGNSSWGATQPTPPLGYYGNVFSPGMVSISSVYWPQILKSSDWPEVQTTKRYFVLYSTDHDIGAGGIYWGEMDNPFFNGFVERGLIIEGNQSETPWLIRIPTAESGLDEDSLFLYYHTSQNTQQTILITSTGGLLHEANWTNRGNPLIKEGTDTHLGYTTVFKRGINDYIFNHKVASGQIQGISYSTDGLTTERQYLIDDTLNMPEGTSFRKEPIRHFTYNDTDYAFGVYYENGTYISVFEVNNDFLPSGEVQQVYQYFDGAQALSFYVENGYAYCYYKEGNNQNVGGPYECFVFDLRTLTI